MSVQDGQPVSAAYTNPAFLKPDVTDYTVSLLGSQNSDSGTGYWIEDFKRYLNQLGTAVGLDVSANYTAEFDTTGNDYDSTSNAVPNGTTFKAAITALSDLFAATTGDGGHAHTGIDGDAPQINISSGTTGTLGYTRGGTNATTAWTTGSIFFGGATSFEQDNANLFWDNTNNFLGLGTNTPATTLDVNGSFALRVGANNTTTGSINNLSTAGISTITFAGASAQTLTGLANGVNGKIVMLINNAVNDLTVADDSGSSSSGNKILTGTGADIAIGPGAACMLQYEETTDYWHLLGGGGGSFVNPMTAKGDLITTTDGSDVVALPLGVSDGDVLTVDSGESTGMKWATPASAPDSSYMLVNCTLAASVAGNDMTIAIKTKAGSDPSAGDPVLVAFRNATLTTGTYTIVSITSALSITIPNGATLGTYNGVEAKFCVGLQLVSGAAELVVSNCGALPTLGRINSLTISGSSNSAKDFYATLGASNVPYRLVGAVVNTQATAGTYATSPSTILLDGCGVKFAPAMGMWIPFTVSVSTGTFTNRLGWRRRNGNMWEYVMQMGPITSDGSGLFQFGLDGITIDVSGDNGPSVTPSIVDTAGGNYTFSTPIGIAWIQQQGNVWYMDGATGSNPDARVYASSTTQVAVVTGSNGLANRASGIGSADTLASIAATIGLKFSVPAVGAFAWDWQ